MNKILPSLLLVTLVIGCRNIDNTICDCCEIGFDSIETALSCIRENPNIDSTSDNRLFLLVFKTNLSDPNENSGWDLLSDPDIINEAKKNYLLIVLDWNERQDLNEKSPPELLRIIREHERDSLFFVITNQALYPFADWNMDENKEIIIDRLQVGNGP